MTKAFYKSKEVWILGIGLLNFLFVYLGWPSVEPTPELISAIFGVLLAIRTLFTQTKLSLVGK